MPKTFPAPPPNQNAYQSSQNYTIDINKLYSDWILTIDSLRSSAALNTQATLKALITQANGDITGLASTLTLSQDPQESRCHAFYRWIGLPVVGSNFKFYNPGFDIISDSKRTFNLQAKLNIASSPLDGFNVLSAARETYVQSNLTIFSNPTSVSAGVLALSSGGTAQLRTFANTAENGQTWSNTNLNNQTYVYNTAALAGGSSTDLSLFQDSNGNTTHNQGFTISVTRTHLIFPLIVDPRIDFCVAPQSKLVAVPFVPDNTYTKINATSNAVAPPLLERIIVERITAVQSADNNGDALQAVLNYVNNLPFIQNNSLVSKAKSYGVNDQASFIDAINTIRAMMNILNKAVKNIAKTEGMYYYLPAPSITGPEGGCSIQGVFLPTAINQNLLTDLDRDIIISTALGTINSSSTDNTNPSNTNVSSTTFNDNTTGALGDNNAKNLATLMKIRNHQLSSANDDLKTIEIIMGEFSGFGLCDVIAIISSLRTIPLSSLMGLLDDDAFERMKTSYAGSWDRDSLTVSMDALTNSVQGFYSIMDQVYINTSLNNNNS